jgi:hypothetical protein
MSGPNDVLMRVDPGNMAASRRNDNAGPPVGLLARFLL